MRFFRPVLPVDKGASWTDTFSVGRSVRSAVLLCCGLLLAGVLSAAESADGATLASSFDQEVKPLLANYCYKCHGEDKQKGDLNLSTYQDGQQALLARKVWKECGEKLTANDMPPEKETKRPNDAERARILSWIQALKQNQPPDPGRVTIHRLNRAEYNNTVRDLIGLDLKPAADFPEDDVGDGFDNIAEVLAIPPLLMEKCLIAADQILDKATTTEQAVFHINADAWTVIEDGKQKTQTGPPADPHKPHPVRLDSISELRGVIAFPLSGKYTVKIRAWGEQSGTDPVNLAIKMDDKTIKEITVPALKGSPGTYTVTIDAPRGMRAVAIAFTNPSAEAPNDNQPKAAGGTGNGTTPKPAPATQGNPGPSAKPRALIVDNLEIRSASPHAASESHKRIFFVYPDGKLGKRDAARQILQRFADRAFRRPASADQIERLLTVFQTASDQGEVFEEAVRLALKGILISPSFLFRIEHDHSPDANGVYRLDDYEIASRLSYFLWSSMPDDELFEAARQGKLHEAADVDKQAVRMLKDAKARALVDNFASQWLQLRRLNYIEPDLAKFPDFTKDMRRSMYDEVTSYVEYVMREDRSVLEFLDSDYTFINERLAKFYGLPAVTGANLRKVSLPDHERGGVLTMAGILAITSLPTRTSPVKRGKWVLEQLLGDPPPPPPAMVPALDKQESVQDGKPVSVRVRLERHRVDPVCASCHQRMDPIGFGLENFDAIGHWRDKDGEEPLDTTGSLPNGQKFNGPMELKAIFLARKERFVTCLTEKLMTYALGRGVEDIDDATIERIGQTMQQNQYRFSVLVSAVVTSYPFLNRKVK